MTFPELYLYDFSGDTHTLEELRPLLGEQRYEYCEQMKSAKAGLSSAFAFLLLRYALKKQFGIKAIPELIIGEHGKPFLKDNPDIFFSLSHVQSRVLCAAAEFPIGADIQDIRKISPSAARKFLTESELKRISPDDTTALCKAWCIKESYSKMTGKGFAEGFTHIDTEELLRSGKAACIKKDGFFISVCVKEI